MKFSVIVPTINNTTVVEKLFDSLIVQEWPEHEILLVDQNDDDKLTPSVDKYKDKLNIRHIRQNAKGVSKARNKGISHATGDIYVFIDDDGTIPKGRFQEAVSYFEQYPDMSLLIGPVLDPDTGFPCIGAIGRDVSLTPLSLILVNGNNTFLRADNFRMVMFDENFGVGSGRFPAGEEGIYAYDLYKAGARGHYIQTFYTNHYAKEQDITESVYKKTYVYSIGYGAMLRQILKDYWSSPSFWILLLKSSVRPIGGIILNLLKADMKRVKFYFIIFKGRFKGFFFYKKLLKSFT